MIAQYLLTDMVMEFHMIRGKWELKIGDKQTGKTTVATNNILKWNAP